MDKNHEYGNLKKYDSNLKLILIVDSTLWLKISSTKFANLIEM